MMNSRALRVGARRPRRGRVGRAVCTSEAMGACDVGCAREGLGGRNRRCVYRRGCWGPLGPERGFGGSQGMPT